MEISSNIMPNKEKYIVVHAGKRDDYQVSIALFENNQLQYLVTDDYFFRYFIISEKRIPLHKVKISITALFWLIMFKIFKYEKLQFYKDRALSNKATKLANKTNSNLLAYSYYALPAFINLKPQLKKILFQLHPYSLYVKNIFEEEIKLIPEAIHSLKKENELLLSKSQLDYLNNEINFADKIICASSFTKKSIIHYFPKMNISVVPYGVNFDNFIFRNKVQTEGKTLNVLFVGSFNQRKGIYYLLDAIQKLQNQNVDIALHLVGRGIIDDFIFEKFNIKKLKISYNLTISRLVEAYHNADVFVLPSICEGFGQVILEAMATGLPIITTENTSGLDIIENGKEGFVIPIRNVPLLVEKLTYFYNNRNEVIEMGKNAFIKSKKYDLDSFKQNLINCINE